MWLIRSVSPKAMIRFYGFCLRCAVLSGATVIHGYTHGLVLLASRFCCQPVLGAAAAAALSAKLFYEAPTSPLLLLFLLLLSILVCRTVQALP
jgi:hypothetical protein